MIGAIGSKDIDDIILFEISDERLLTFQNFVRTNGVRFAKHDTLGKKPVSQYVGPDLDSITLRIELKYELGVNPQTEMDKLIYLQRNGATISIIVGNKAFGIFRWTITSLKMAWDRISSEGFLMAAGCDITLQEYV